MTLKKENIIRVGITGAAGVIGRVLTKGLADKYDLSLFGHSTEIEQNSYHEHTFVKVDISRAEQVEGIFRGLDAVIHLAAESRSRAPWESILAKNIIGTYNVFEEARRAAVKKFVFASTNHVQQGYTMLETTTSLDTSYVIRKGHIKLSDPPAPDSYYAVSKLFGENMGYYYWRVFGMQVIALRIGSTFPEDDPTFPRGITSQDYERAMFLSQKDCVQAFVRALQVDCGFLLAYAISNNDRRVYDLTLTKAVLGFNPEDNAEYYFQRSSGSK